MPAKMRKSLVESVDATLAAHTQLFEQKGVEGFALVCMIKYTAPLRHAARVAEARQSLQHLSPLLKAAAGLADSEGVGGRCDIEGSGSVRLPIFNGIPTKMAPSAGAWASAIEEATCLVDSEGRVVSVQFAAQGGKLFVTTHPSDPGAAREEVPFDVVHPRWQRAIAGRHLRQLLLISSREVADDEIAEWVALYNATHEQCRVD